MCVNNDSSSTNPHFPVSLLSYQLPTNVFFRDVTLQLAMDVCVCVCVCVCMCVCVCILPELWMSTSLFSLAKDRCILSGVLHCFLQFFQASSGSLPLYRPCQSLIFHV
jgi:hypothetical protein